MASLGKVGACAGKHVLSQSHDGEALRGTPRAAAGQVHADGHDSQGGVPGTVAYRESPWSFQTHVRGTLEEFCHFGVLVVVNVPKKNLQLLES